jgi:hypothetical protein
MKIIDAAPELVADILEEMEVSESKEKASFIVRVGHHPTMGRIVVISGARDEAAIVQMT